MLAFTKMSFNFLLYLNLRLFHQTCYLPNVIIVFCYQINIISVVIECKQVLDLVSMVKPKTPRRILSTIHKIAAGVLSPVKQSCYFAEDKLYFNYFTHSPRKIHTQVVIFPYNGDISLNETVQAFYKLLSLSV